MKARGLVLAAIVVAGGGSAAPERRAAQAPVTCDVIVLGPDAVPAIGLVQDDFEVMSDGAPVPIVSLGPTPVPFTVVLLLDLTTSQPLKRYEVLAAVSTDWLGSLGPGDRARLATVGSPPVISTWLPAARPPGSPIGRSLIDNAANEPSPIWDNIVAVMDAMNGVAGPKHVVLLTDGRSAGNAHGLEDVATLAVAGDVVISSVSEGWDWLVPPPASAPPRVRPDASLQWLADVTGGMYLEDAIARRVSPRVNSLAYVQDIVRSPNLPGPLLARVMTALHQRYRIGFTGVTDGRPHALEVRVRKPGLVVRVKRSYTAGVAK